MKRDGCPIGKIQHNNKCMPLKDYLEEYIIAYDFEKIKPGTIDFMKKNPVIIYYYPDRNPGHLAECQCIDEYCWMNFFKKTKHQPKKMLLSAFAHELAHIKEILARKEKGQEIDPSDATERRAIHFTNRLPLPGYTQKAWYRGVPE